MSLCVFLFFEKEVISSDILAVMLHQPNKLFSNFWGAISQIGFYARSEDYIPIVEVSHRSLTTIEPVLKLFYSSASVWECGTFLTSQLRIS